MSAGNKQKVKNEHLDMMPKELEKELHPILKLQADTNENQVVAYLVRWLISHKIPYKIDDIGNILVTKGKTDHYPCVVSHMDTVHSIKKDYTVRYKTKNGRKYAHAFSNKTMVGVGGDDKCGIFATLKMIERCDNIKAVFFTQEETGMDGSSNIDLNYFSDVGYIIQLDRWGRGDFIDCYGGESTVGIGFTLNAINTLRDYGYKSTEGLITDSINLWLGYVGIACVNVSCGYYQHHSSSEFIDLNELYNSILFLGSLIDALGEEKYLSEPAPIEKNYNTYDHYDDKEPDFNLDAFEGCMDITGWCALDEVTDHYAEWMTWAYNAETYESVTTTEMRKCMEEYRAYYTEEISSSENPFTPF